MTDNSSDRDAKRERFVAARPPAPRARRIVTVAALTLLLVALALGAALALPRLTTPATPTIVSGPAALAATQGHEPYPEVVAENGSIRLLAAEFGDGIARHYTYMHNGQPIEFLVVQSSDGVIRAAFNACDDCYPGQRGYIQDGDEMICMLCGNRFATDQINVVRGGCNPAPLQRTIQGSLVVIRVSDLVAGARFF
jgi:uncharacterized membrane protein